MLSNYIKDIEAHYGGPLSPKEEIDTVHKIKKGDKKAVDTLIGCNLKFVITIAKKYLGQGLPLADLIGAGNLGLIKAAKRYDPESHNKDKFITFAVWWIKHYIFDAILMYKFAYRIPNSYLNDIFKYLKAKDKIKKQNKGNITKKQILAKLNINEDRLQIIEGLISNGKFVNLSDKINDERGVTFEDVITNKSFNIEDLYILRERRKTIYNCLSKLNKIDRHIIVKYYGLDGDQRSLRQLGEEFNLTREAVRVKRDKALAKIKFRDCEILKDFLHMDQ